MGTLFDFTATYVNQDKQVVQERITSLPWSKKITATPPFDAHLEVDFAAKNNYLDQTTYEVGFNGRIEQSDISKSVANTIQSKVKDGKLRFSVTLPSGVSSDGVNLSIAPLKYDKHFAFTYTVDDASETAWSRIFPLIHRKWIDEKEFFHLGNTPTTGYIPEHTLSMTDGCGNDRRFGFGVGITPTFRNFYNGEAHNPRMQETSKNSMYVTWEELRLMLDFGCSVHFHNVDETKYNKTDPIQILQGLEDDYNKVIEKLGYKMKVLALPDGLQSYLDASRSFKNIEFIRSSLSNNLIRLKSCGGLLNKETYGGDHTSDITLKLGELAKQAAATDPYWVGMTVHRPDAKYMAMLTEVYKLYGKAGADNIWAASWDEVYEYQELRYGSTINKSVEGQTVTFEITLPDRPDFTFRDLSFIVDGVNEDCSIAPVSGNIYGLNHAVRNGKMLVNVNFNPALLVRAEKYTAKYEASAKETDKDDAMYFVSMLLPDLAAPFIYRIENRKDRPAITSITINGGANTVYDRFAIITSETSGNPTVYRIGETSDLSAAEWKPYNPELSYTLTPSFGRKTIYLQVANGTLVSDVASSVILYADVPQSGTISRDAVKAYQMKYDKHKFTVDKKIEAK